MIITPFQIDIFNALGILGCQITDIVTSGRAPQLTIENGFVKIDFKMPEITSIRVNYHNQTYRIGSTSEDSSPLIEVSQNGILSDDSAFKERFLEALSEARAMRASGRLGAHREREALGTEKERISELERQRAVLSHAIAEAAIKTGICRPDIDSLSGAQLLLLLTDLANGYLYWKKKHVTSVERELERILADCAENAFVSDALRPQMEKICQLLREAS